jgi:predicted enzyme related to lactoylglutathione lyase
LADIPHVGMVVEFADSEGNIACAMEFVKGHALAAG